MLYNTAKDFSSLIRTYWLLNRVDKDNNWTYYAPEYKPFFLTEVIIWNDFRTKKKQLKDLTCISKEESTLNSSYAVITKNSKEPTTFVAVRTDIYPLIHFYWYGVYKFKSLAYDIELGTLKLCNYLGLYDPEQFKQPSLKDMLSKWLDKVRK